VTKTKWIVVCLPFLGCLALLGCPKENAASSDAAASAAPTSSDPTAPAQPGASTPATPTDGGKTSTLVLPKLNLDGAAALVDAGLAVLADAGLPTIPTAVPSASTTGVTGVPPECNQYATQQAVCISKMAPALQPAATGALNAAKGSWPTLAATPAGHDALLAQCKGLLAQANACK
jgi:hypothetical protein